MYYYEKVLNRKQQGRMFTIWLESTCLNKNTTKIRLTINKLAQPNNKSTNIFDHVQVNRRIFKNFTKITTF